jgi:hypothetical protein
MYASASDITGLLPFRVAPGRAVLLGMYRTETGKKGRLRLLQAQGNYQPILLRIKGLRCPIGLRLPASNARRIIERSAPADIPDQGRVFRFRGGASACPGSS